MTVPAVIRLFLIFLLAWPAFASGQVVLKPSGGFEVRMAGRVLSREDGRPVAFASVRNLSTRRGITADSGGFFTIILGPRDTVEFRRVGFRPLYYQKDPGHNGNYYEDVLLEALTNELKEVTIYRKRAPIRSIALNPDYARRDPFRIQLFGPAKTRQSPATIANPLSFLYEQYSRRGRSLRKLEGLQEQKDLDDLAGYRYNEYYVQSLTGLRGPDLDAFLRYCPMQPTFVIRATDYELAAATLNCYRRFMDDL